MIVKRKYIIISENIHNKIFTLEWLIVIRILFRIYSYFFSFWSSRAWIIHSNWFVFVLTGLGRGTYGGRSCEWSVLQHRTFVTALCCVWEAEEWLGWGLGGIMFCIFNLNKLLQDWRPTNNLFNSQIVFKLFFFLPSHFISYFYMIKVKSPTACRTPNHTFVVWIWIQMC